MAAPAPLKCLILLGSMRGHEANGPFPGRLGERVKNFLIAQLPKQEFEIRVADPAEPEYSLPLLNMPYHWSRILGTEVTPNVQRLNDNVAWADCYVFVTPEYNHSISPGLTNLVCHIAPTAYGGKMGLKPSLLVTYSMGKFGGSRAGVQLLALAAEIGTLPCSVQTNIIEAHITLDKQGKEIPPANWGEDSTPPITLGFQKAKKEFLFVGRALASARLAADEEKKRKRLASKAKL